MLCFGFQQVLILPIPFHSELSSQAVHHAEGLRVTNDCDGQGELIVVLLLYLNLQQSRFQVARVIRSPR